MIRSVLSVLVLAAAALATPAATAQPSTPDNADARFTFHRADDGGYMRLDGKTGWVSHCSRRPAGWECHVVPDERTAFEAEIARLQTDNAALKKELLAHNLPLPNGVQPEPQVSKPNEPRQESRNEARLRRVMHEIDKIWRRIVDMIASVQREIMKRT